MLSITKAYLVTIIKGVSHERTPSMVSGIVFGWMHRVVPILVIRWCTGNNEKHLHSDLFPVTPEQGTNVCENHLWFTPTHLHFHWSCTLVPCIYNWKCGTLDYKCCSNSNVLYKVYIEICIYVYLCIKVHCDHYFMETS